mmetsp:Transcript_585/g.1898  ORF Transcript_585/g.1898 Transcript_585/m.1898 type:complete len:108 (+) Transcript_585:1-324(+)
MGSARGGCAAVPVDAHHVLVISGQDSSITRSATTELLNIAMMESAPGPALRVGRCGCAAAQLDAARRRCGRGSRYPLYLVRRDDRAVRRGGRNNLNNNGADAAPRLR